MNKSIKDLHLLALNDAIYSGRNSRPALEILFNNILFNTTTHDNEKRRTENTQRRSKVTQGDKIRSSESNKVGKDCPSPYLGYEGRNPPKKTSTGKKTRNGPTQTEPYGSFSSRRKS
jgi:hypothetical protein